MAVKLFDRIKRLGNWVFRRSGRESVAPAARYVYAEVQTQPGPRYTDAATQTESSPKKLRPATTFNRRGDIDKLELFRRTRAESPQAVDPQQRDHSKAARLGVKKSNRIPPPMPSMDKVHRHIALAAMEGSPVHMPNIDVSTNVREQRTPQPFAQPLPSEQSAESIRADRTVAMAAAVSKRMQKAALAATTDGDQKQIAATLSKLDTISSKRSALAGKTGTRDRDEGRA